MSVLALSRNLGFYEKRKQSSISQASVEEKKKRFSISEKKNYSGSPWQGREVKTTEQKEDESNSAWRNNDGPFKKQTRLSVFLSLLFSAVMLPPDSMYLSSEENIQADSLVNSEQLQNHKLNSSKHIQSVPLKLPALCLPKPPHKPLG